MKKKLLKLFALIFCVGLFLTGCATLSSVKDSEGKNVCYAEPVYFQGQVAKVGDYLYYGNAYVDISAEDFNYKKAKDYSYMSRVDLSSLSFDDEVIEDNKKHTAPEKVEKVIKNRVAGYINQEMYAYGEYLYFTSANIHKTSTMLNDYTMVSFFRVKFNGTGFEELGTFTHDENSTITMQKGSDDNYYFVIVCPTDVNTEESSSDKTYDVFSMKVGQTVGKAKKLVGEVSTAVVADESSTRRDVVYSHKTESTILPNAVSSVDFATGDVTEYTTGDSKVITLIDRVDDIVFYSYNKEIYYKNVASVSAFDASNNFLFYSAESISNVIKLGEGYIFEGISALMYKSSISATAEKLTAKENYSDILFVDGDYIYLSNDSSIMKISNEGGEVEKIVEMTIISGECGYADGYIYFYANRGVLVDEEGENIEEEQTDSTYYLYQTDKLGNIQRIGQAK